MRTIALEEHFVTPAFMDGPGRRLKERAETSGGRSRRLSLSLPTSAMAAWRRWTPPKSTSRRCR